MLLRCSQSREQRREFVIKKWLYIKEKFVYETILGRIKKLYNRTGSTLLELNNGVLTGSNLCKQDTTVKVVPTKQFRGRTVVDKSRGQHTTLSKFFFHKTNKNCQSQLSLFSIICSLNAACFCLTRSHHQANKKLNKFLITFHCIILNHPCKWLIS
jgi:hypothetical protein